VSSADFDAARSALSRARSARDAAAVTGADPAERARLKEFAEAAYKDFAVFSDPRSNVEQLPDRSPFVLLPVRLETRFVHTPTEQLWVRIYPDDCSIDTYEPTLSATELANAKVYWRAIWAAGGMEDGERAAWRTLVAAHGSGRAGWIVDNYQPVNMATIPAKTAASDEILVIGAQPALSAAEAAAISAYWQAIWLAGDASAAQNAARTALVTAVGSARADALVAGYRPANLGDVPQPPLRKQDVALSTAFVVFPPDPPTKPGSWSQAPQVRWFPERFVVLGFVAGEQVIEAVGGLVEVPLYVGPDPTADPADTIHPDGGDLFVPDELAWMVDFNRAVKAGMGVVIPLTPVQARNGFDRLLVVGLQLGASDVDGAASLEELLQHHAVGRSGLSLVPQGTPTHNTSGSGTGYTKLDDADESFTDRLAKPLFTVTSDPDQKRDGQWLSEMLGVDPSLLQGVHAADGRDQLQARAMQRALWPATLGYWMDKLFAPVFDDQTIELTRWYFTNFVSGRGAVPTIRIGGQPYGVLPVTAFSRIRWLDELPGEVRRSLDVERGYLARLFALLREVDDDWTAMSRGAAHVGAPGDAHQTLLDVVGLHPASVEFYSRNAESLDELYNIVSLWGFGPDFWQAIIALGLESAGQALLARLGYSGRARPDVLNHVFLSGAGLLSNVIDDRPLSESTPIRAYTTDNRNYLHWLADSASSSLDDVVAEHGFTGDVSPQALLYLYARHALMLGYYDTSYQLHRQAGFLSETELLAMKPEPVFVHVAEAAAASESRFAALYKTEARITGQPSVLVSDFITSNLGAISATARLTEQVEALKALADAPTAALERLFAEHIDTCSYRFDSWLLGLVSFQLQEMRAGDDGEGDGTGVFLGAYAWLENLRPSLVDLTPVELPPDLAASFPGDTPIQSDPTNGGYIHAPSLQHARTAAVLRSGYLANATQANATSMAVNLSSDRVRLALSLLEGVRGGQPLGGLLGYRFERGLHDAHGLAEVDQFIYPLRKCFPLVADTLTPTATPPDVPIEAIEARNVIDGRKLVEHLRTSGNRHYPFDQTTLPTASPVEAAAIDAEADALFDLYDAVADLALAEGVHQAVQGNFERVASTLDAYTTGNYPPEPEIVQTPPSGIGLTLRVALHLEAGKSAPAGATPRAVAEPAVDSWLASVLPPFGQVGATVSWTDPVTGTARETTVTLAELGLRPLDLLALLRAQDAQIRAELDDRVVSRVLATVAPRPDAVLTIRYAQAPAGGLSLFEVSPLVRSLKTVVEQARPLRASDATMQGSATSEQDAEVFVDRSRVAGPKAVLDTLSVDIATFLATLSPLVADPVTNRAAIEAGIDGFLDGAVTLLERAAAFNLPNCGWGFAHVWRSGTFAGLQGRMRALADRWDARLAEFDTRITAYDALPATTAALDRFRALQGAETLVSTSLEPLPATPATLRSDLNALRAAFVMRRNAFAALLLTNDPRVSASFTAIDALLPVSAFDAQDFDITDIRDRAVIFAQDLVTTLTGHGAEVDNRRAAVQTQLDAHDAAASAATRVEALQIAAQALLGEEFFLVPEFEISAAQGQEWADALSSTGPLLDYLTTAQQIDFPVDEWLYGAARVRPMLHAWESVVLLTGPLGRPEPTLVPAQFPYDATAPWLAMQYPPEYVLDSDRLLYTAHYTKPFDKTARQCGLLVDEWTEVIPATDRTTGMTFNANRPDNEAPQAILVVTSASAAGAWQWADLVGALHETLDLAKKRAIEPVDIDNTAYSRFLPATIMASTLYGISITTTLAAASTSLNAVRVTHDA
jgi:hypothetical protein